jgi:hypothetical protein
MWLINITISLSSFAHESHRRQHLCYSRDVVLASCACTDNRALSGIPPNSLQIAGAGGPKSALIRVIRGKNFQPKSFLPRLAKFFKEIPVSYL